MDALFFFRHSIHGDIEIRYALRGIAKHMPWVRKVWIFGDRPRFLVDDPALVEVVSHEYMARIGKFRTPVTNFFLMFYLASLIPDLEPEILWFCDDFIIINDLAIDDARKDRYIVDMDTVKDRPKGLWQESLWRTYDFLKHLGYPGYNFEIHAPTYFTKRRIFEAYRDFKDLITENRWYGMLGPSAILNHAVVWDDMQLVQRGPEGRWLGFYGEAPPYDEIVRRAEGKFFFNVDDDSFTPDARRFLAERLPDRCRYEKDDVEPAAGLGTGNVHFFPRPCVPSRDAIPEFLNLRGLTGEAVEVGVLRGEFSARLLGKWQGRRLHCVDPWRASAADGRYVDRHNVAQEPHERNYAEAVACLALFADRCKIHRLTSRQAAELFAPRSLDFVYLDARHFREAMEEDLALWAPKVRPGGFLAGHDYLDGILPSGHFEVKTVVDAWAAAQGLPVLCTGENVWRSWLIEMV